MVSYPGQIMKPNLFLIAKIGFLLSALKTISSARSRSSSEDSDATVVLSYSNAEEEELYHSDDTEREVFEAPLYEAPVEVEAYDEQQPRDESLASPPEIRGSNWCRIYNMTNSDTFFLQSVYHSKDLLKKLQKYQQLHPSEELGRLIDFYFQMDRDPGYNSSSWHFYIPSISVTLPESFKRSDFIKQIASIDEYGNPVNIDNMFINGRGYRPDFPVRSIISSKASYSKPATSDIFLEIDPRTYANIEFEIFVLGDRYRLQTLADTSFAKERIAMQGSSNRPYFVVISAAYTRYGQDAEQFLNSETWNLLHYRKVEHF